MHHAFLYISLPLQSKTTDQQLCTCITLFCTFLCRYCMTTTWTECLFSGTVEHDVNTKERHLFFQTCFQFSLTVLLFYLMYASFRSVTDRNSKILTPTRKGNFLLTSMDREFYATDVNTKERPCFSFLEVRYTLLEFNSRKNRQHLTNWTRWNKCNDVRLHFVSDVFVPVAVVVA